MPARKASHVFFRLGGPLAGAMLMIALPGCGSAGGDTLEEESEAEVNLAQQRAADVAAPPPGGPLSPTPGGSTTTSSWQCFNRDVELGNVSIGWGHTASDASWACNAWLSACGNAKGGCTAKKMVLSNWRCSNKGVDLGPVSLWWGHTASDASWACNTWLPACGNAKGGCTATEERITNWQCSHYGVDLGDVSLWWGHTAVDASWACNAWLPACAGAQDGCSATQAYTDWHCWNKGVNTADVHISWGHTAVDAAWECNAWIPACSDDKGGCHATEVVANGP